MDKPRPKRILLRMPVELGAKLYLAGASPASIIIRDVSSNGFSFFVPASTQLPDLFMVSLRLGIFAQEMLFSVAVVNRIAMQDKLRVGCKFFEISDEQQEKLARFISRNMNVHLLIRLLHVAAFLCLVDSLWRIAAFLVYAQGLWFGAGPGLPVLDYFYFAILLVYACSSAIAFLTEIRLAEPAVKQRFFLSVFCLAVVSCIVIPRALFYWWTWLVNPTNIILNVIVVIYSCLAGFVLVATRHGLVSLNRLDEIIQIFKQHRSYLQEDNRAS